MHTRLPTMKRICTTATFSLATVIGALMLTPTAQAYCPPGSWFCAEVHVGGYLQAPPPPPRQQIIIMEPAPPPPPVVILQPAPPPPPPRAQVVLVGPAPPAEVVVIDQERPRQWGLHGHIGGAIGPEVRMGGMGGALRLRPNDGYLAVDLGLGAYAGQDFNGYDRVEVPMTADLLLFLNPESTLQVYGLVGLGISVAHSETPIDLSYPGPVYYDTYETRDFVHMGAQIGAGLELRLSSSFALNADLRGFVRQRVDGDEAPEFVEVNDRGEPTGRSTDTSGGGLLTLGGTIYF